MLAEVKGRPPCVCVDVSVPGMYMRLCILGVHMCVYAHSVVCMGMNAYGSSQGTRSRMQVW